MAVEWGPVVVAVILFILLSPGLLFQVPARTRVVEFGNMCTSGVSVLVHAVFFFVLFLNHLDPEEVCQEPHPVWHRCPLLLLACCITRKYVGFCIHFSTAGAWFSLTFFTDDL
uniref:Uncharacterized protein n=1 Tax=Oryza meridionalis TaxID=40149 RepID=A0A0E0CKY7_9ORYZ